MFKERIYFASQHFVASHLLLLILFFLIRTMEFVFGAMAHSLPENAASLIISGYLFDLWFVMVLGTFGYLIYTGLYLLIGSSTRYLLFLVFLVYVLCYISLVQYYNTTSIPLSADFWGYSARDIQTTVSASAGFSVFTVLPFVVALGVLFYAYKRVQELIVPQWFVWSYGSVSLAITIVYFLFPPSPAWFSTDTRYAYSVNKLAYFTEKSTGYYIEKNAKPKEEIDAEYPLVHNADTSDVLGPYFDSLPAKPNIVVLMVEGLGGTFVGPSARYGGCTPFLDSLAQHSLYWQYFLSTSGRTFGVLPGLLGSLPYGEKGFMEAGSNMPAHLTLFRLLKMQGYKTRYFYGGDANFDLQDVFLERQGIDYILDEAKFTRDYTRLPANSGGFSWGFSDADLFNYSLELFPADTSTAHLSVYMTITTHEPFIAPNQEVYLKKLEQVSAKRPAQQKEYKEYSPELSCLLYTDDAIRNFINAYKSRADYKNTIFIITGDHRMIPIDQASRIDRFHVPLILFSPMLKRTAMFSSVSSHHDVTPTLIGLLQQNTPMRFPQKVHWLGHMIDTTREFRSLEDVPLMRNKNELIDYIDHDYFMSDNILYRITPKLDLERVDDNGKLEEIQEKMAHFKQVNQYVFVNNKIYNDSMVSKLKPEFVLTRIEEFMVKSIPDSLDSDDRFWLARKYIFAGNYHMGQVLCKGILRNKPNHSDVRILLGRSYAWQGKYDEARKQFEESISRSPDCSDAYTALIDMEAWADHYTKAIQLADDAYKRFNDKSFIEQKKKVIGYMSN